MVREAGLSMGSTHDHPSLSSQAAEWIDAYVHPHGYCLANFDPALVIASDLANLAVAGAYMLGFPFCAWRLFPVIPSAIRTVYVLGILFVYTCGLGHFLDVVITHHASYGLYIAVIAEAALTGIISWAFVLAVFSATRNVGLRVITDDTPGAENVPRVER